MPAPSPHGFSRPLWPRPLTLAAGTTVLRALPAEPILAAAVGGMARGASSLDTALTCLHRCGEGGTTRALALAFDSAILGTEPTEAELATAKAVGAHGAASLDTALRSRLHRRCSNRGTPLAVALAAKTAVGRAGPAKAELAAA